MAAAFFAAIVGVITIAVRLRENIEQFTSTRASF
jgi:hypothetical protein